MAAHYDDPGFLYTDYWPGRNYEHQSEVIAITRLLENSRFNNSVDIGGGFGRLIPALIPFSKKIILIEPSNKLRSIAQKTYPSDKQVTVISGTAQKTNLSASSQDLAMLVRVLHHIPDPLPVFKEIYRILKPEGIFILEFANSFNFKAKIQSWVTGQPILLIPVEKRKLSNIRRKTIPFVNHSPVTINRLLAKTGFTIEKKLSVSNFRLPFIKNILPVSLLIKLEKYFQPVLSGFDFGPSIFILAKKPNP
jgi:ubiquinone/menaquinone biosynthesis C-methylase UbiE